MQDRFKFRQWDKNTKMMGYYNCDENSLHTLMIPCGKNIMQCTGLKDKNDKLIFEGDIVTVACGHFVIKYCDVCKSFQCFCDDECFACNGDYHWFEFLDDEREIIGNIHENPDFLEW